MGLSRRSVWYQYGFGIPQGPIASRFTGGELRRFATFVRERLGLSVDAASDRVSVRTSRTSHTTPLRAVLLTRHVTRKILNERQLADAIQKVILRTVNEGDVRIASLEENGLAELIRLISDSTVLIGMHGAALSLAMFLPRGSLLIEMWPYGINPTSASVYKTMCALKNSGITYMTWTNEDECNTRTHPEYAPHLGGVWHMSSAERERVTAGLSGAKLTSVTCCDDPDWLYRIYQDTEVRLYANDGEYTYGNSLKSVPFTDVLRNGLLMLRQASRPAQTPQKHTPARIRDLRCMLRKDGTGVVVDVAWRNPWTVEALGCENVKYEVITASSLTDSSDVTSDYVKSEVYVRRFDYVLKALHVWVTCLCEGVEGPVAHGSCAVT